MFNFVLDVRENINNNFVFLINVFFVVYFLYYYIKVIDIYLIILNIEF